MICPACDLSFWTAADRLAHLAQMFLAPDDRHRRLCVHVRDVTDNPYRNWPGHLSGRTTVATFANPGSVAPGLVPGTTAPASPWRLSAATYPDPLSEPDTPPDTTNPYWLKLLYQYVQSQSDLASPPPADLIFSAVADLPAIANAVRRTLAEIEREHVKEALTKIAEGA